MLSPVVEKVVFESFWALDMAPTWAVPGLFVDADSQYFRCWCKLNTIAPKRFWIQLLLFCCQWKLNEFCFVLLTVYHHSAPSRPYIDSLHHILHFWHCLFQRSSRNFNCSIVSNLYIAMIFPSSKFPSKSCRKNLKRIGDITDPCGSSYSPHFRLGPFIPFTFRCISLLFMKPSRRFIKVPATAFPHNLTAKPLFHT